ncbi:MAG: acyltransferase [Eubacterium sp.]|jgi:peptidoglycan/LPS O-acetylase OafA/YrhL|nr:acyltransferase [Eubacterium sp.]
MSGVRRRYDVDWIRTVAVLLIIPFHAAIIYNTDPDAIMYVKSGINVHQINLFEFFLDRFHMTLLFFLAGMAIYYSLLSRTTRQFAGTRTKKLLLPTVVGVFTFCPITTYVFARQNGSQDSLLSHYIGFFTRPVGGFEGVNGGFTPMHLWFILFLFVYSFIGIPVFRAVISEKGRRLTDALADFFSKPLMFLLLTVPYSMIFLVDLMDERNPVAYFFVVILGFIFASNDKFQKAVNRDKWIYLALSAGILLLWYLWVKENETGSTFILYLKYFITKAARLIPTFALLGLGNSFIKTGGRTLRYLSEASFPVYIIHMPVVTYVGYLLLKFNIKPVYQYILIISLSYMICFILYETYRRLFSNRTSAKAVKMIQG